MKNNLIISLLLFIGLGIWSCEDKKEDKHGCLDSQACNYDSAATIDNNSCIYTVDCEGVCGGNKLLDNCGSCDNDTTNDCVQDCFDEWGGNNICGCTDSTATNYDSSATYDDGTCSYGNSGWTVIGSGLDVDVEKNALTEFVGSTNCPYCPAQDALLLSYLDPSHGNYVGSNIADRWSLINYHTYSPSRGDPMYEFLRGVSETGEDDFCYVRFEEGSWYTIYGVPTTFTNGFGSAVYPEMAVAPLAQSTPLSISLDGTTINGSEISVQVSISSSRDMTASDSLHLFIAATLDNVDYTGYNGAPHHQDVFLGWINDGLSGELLSLGNEEVVKSYSWEMPSNWPQNNFETSWSQVEYDVSNLAVVAFIQNKYTKEIMQVAGSN